MKRIALFFLILVILVRIGYYAATEGFCPDRILIPSQTLESKVESVSSSSNELKSATQLPFAYLKKGSQAYAFVSADSQYVLKLFKRHHMQDPKWVENIPTFGPLTKWKKILIQKRRRKLNLVKNSYGIAITKLKKECGIVAAQLNPAPGQFLPVELIDGIGRKHTVNIAQCGYVLQKKASLIYPSFISWINQKDLQSCQVAIQSMASLIASRSHLGIEDVDPDIHKNAGLIGTDAVFIDIGGFVDKGSPLSKGAFAYDIKKIFKEFKSFLSKKEPSLVPFLDQTIEKEIERY